MPFTLILLIVAAAAALLFGVWGLLKRTPAQRRLFRLADGSRVPIDGERGTSLARDPHSRLAHLLAPLAGKAARDAAPTVFPIRRRLVEAGYRQPSALAIYMGSRALFALLLPLVSLLVPTTWTLDEKQMLLLMGVASFLGLMAPSAWVSRKRRLRQESIVLGLPDALDLMVVCVEAGLGINASFARIAQEMTGNHPMLSAEFQLVTLEVRAGKSSIEALRSLAERTGLSEVSSLAAMLIQTERFGTNLADTLRVHADAMRSDRLLRAEEKAAVAPLRMLFPTALIFAATLLVTLGPAAIQLFGFFADHL